MTLLVDTLFTTNPNGHGGDHRTAQIAELIAQANLTTVPFERTLLKTPSERVLAATQALLNPQTYRFITKHRLEIRKQLSAIAFCGFQRQLYQRVLQQHSGSRLLLWEATKNYVAPYVASENQFKVIALPHNLEALVPDQGAIFESLEIEVNALATADVVFCISREEEWFLRTRGVHAHYLPYYPPQPVLQRFREVREARRDLPKSRFLIHGNAKNHPTRQGMIELLEGLKTVRDTLEFEVDIVGYGTERLQDYCDRTGFHLHGAVPAEHLQQLLMTAKAALIHQVPTSGALTRIPELLIAGIPVIANRNACRSTSDYQGIYCYDDWFELTDLMSQSLETPEIVPRPVVSEKRFIECVLKLLKN